MVCPVCANKKPEPMTPNEIYVHGERREFYDREGRWHLHHDPDLPRSFTCSNGHSWIENPRVDHCCGG